MEMFFTSDHHFGHQNIIKYTNRPYKNISEMDEDLIYRWNCIIGPNDMVYHLGDFTLGNASQATIYFKRLNGIINILPGSHDQSWFDYTELYRSKNGNKITLMHPMITIHSRKIGFGKATVPSRREGSYSGSITMCHYAMKVWPASHYGTFHLFGHSHGQLTDPSINSMDVGVDTNEFYPYNLDDILEILDEQ